MTPELPNGVVAAQNPTAAAKKSRESERRRRRRKQKKNKATDASAGDESDAGAAVNGGDSANDNSDPQTAIELKPRGGIHVLYKDRAAARIAIGNVSDALEDVKEALTLAPNYPEAYIIQGDAFMAIEQFDGAEESYSNALELDPSIRRSKSFKDRIAKLQEKFIVTQ